MNEPTNTSDHKLMAEVTITTVEFDCRAKIIFGSCSKSFVAIVKRRMLNVLRKLTKSRYSLSSLQMAGQLHFVKDRPTLTPTITLKKITVLTG